MSAMSARAASSDSERVSGRLPVEAPEDEEDRTKPDEVERRLRVGEDVVYGRSGLRWNLGHWVRAGGVACEYEREARLR